MSAVPVIPPHAHQRTPRLRPAFQQAAAAFILAASFIATWTFTQHKASVKRLSEIPLTVTGIAFIDFAAFHVAHGLGWLVTGISLLILEHLIADE